MESSVTIKFQFMFRTIKHLTLYNLNTPYDSQTQSRILFPYMRGWSSNNTPPARSSKLSSTIPPFGNFRKINKRFYHYAPIHRSSLVKNVWILFSLIPRVYRLITQMPAVISPSPEIIHSFKYHQSLASCLTIIKKIKWGKSLVASHYQFDIFKCYVSR